MARIKSAGNLEYSVNETCHKLVVVIDPEISRYYRSLIPKSYLCNPQRHAPHITVVRNEIPTNLDKWGLHEGKLVTFSYDPVICYNKIYWWINCYSSFLEKIRNELGLPIYSEYNSPPDLKRCFHTTIGNSKK